jgi:iron complex transport system substrate-binding protein
MTQAASFRSAALYALGLSDRIVAIDTTSLYPARALKEKPNVGYMRALAAEGVLGLNPSLVLAIDGSGPKETVSVLEQATVPFVRVPDHYTAEGIVEKVRMIADVAGVHDRGECLAGQVKADLAELEKLRAKLTQPKKVLFVLSFLNGKPMVAGRNTAADGLIRLAGAVNAMDGYEGYKQISDEAVITAAPDAVLAMQRPQDNLDATTVFANAAFSTTPAAARKSFVAMDGLYLLGFGPRTARAARDLAATLYPSLGRDILPSERKTSDCH